MKTMKLELRPMTAEEFPSFLNRNLSRYAREILLTGATDVEAHALAEAQVALRALVFTVETHYRFLRFRQPSD